MLRESGARVLFVPDVFRGRDYAAMAGGLRGRVAGARARHRPRTTIRASDALPDRLAPLAGGRRRDQLAQLLFTSGTSGEPKGVLHRHDMLMRAADQHIDHFGLDADDVIYIPSPLAHQTGFLYGMWIALRARRAPGAPGGLGRRGRASTRCERFGVTFVQAATPFLADLSRVAAERGADARTACGRSSPPAPRSRASWRARSREVLGAEVGGAWGTTESCLGCAFVPGDRRPNAPGAPTAARSRGISAARRRRRGRTLSRRRGGQLRGRYADCLFAGYLNRPELTGEARHRRRLVPHRRPRLGSTRTATSGSPAGSRT